MDLDRGAGSTPRLKLVFVEPGLAWVAWWLHVVDDMVLRQGYEFPGLSELPSFYFHQNVHLTFIEEDFSLEFLRDRIGVHNIMWSLITRIRSRLGPSHGRWWKSSSKGYRRMSGTDPLWQRQTSLESADLGRLGD